MRRVVRNCKCRIVGMVRGVVGLGSVSRGRLGVWVRLGWGLGVRLLLGSANILLIPSSI